MTFSAPSTDFYDDGLVHSHDWSRNTPPGGAHGDRSRGGQSQRTAHDHGYCVGWKDEAPSIRIAQAHSPSSRPWAANMAA
jgi:hypothetical protein